MYTELVEAAETDALVSYSKYFYKFQLKLSHFREQFQLRNFVKLCNNVFELKKK